MEDYPYTTLHLQNKLITAYEERIKQLKEKIEQLELEIASPKEE